MTRRAAAPIAALLAVVVVALPAAAVTRGVRVGSFYFEDSSSGDGQVVVAQGDRITFSFEDSQHTATVDGMFDSGVKGSGESYTTGTLTRPGTFTLYCQVHGATRHGTTLVIRATASPSPSPTSAQPSPSPTKAKPSPTPTRSPSARPSPSATPTPRPTPSPSPTPSATRSPSPSPSATPTPSATAAALSTSPAASRVPAATSPEAAPSDTPDVARATPVEDDGSSWLLPVSVLLLLLLLGAVAIALGRRRQIG